MPFWGDALDADSHNKHPMSKMGTPPDVGIFSGTCFPQVCPAAESHLHRPGLGGSDVEKGAGGTSPPHMDVSPKIVGFPPKSSIFIGFSITNHPFWDTPSFGNTHILQMLCICLCFVAEKKRVLFCMFFFGVYCCMSWEDVLCFSKGMPKL